MASEQIGTSRRDAPPLRTDEDLLHPSYQDLIRARCSYTLGRKRDRLLDDAIQDTNFKALGDLRKGTHVRNAKAWLARIAYNACLNLIRAETKHLHSTTVFQADHIDNHNIDKEISDHGWFSVVIFEMAEWSVLYNKIAQLLTSRQNRIFDLALEGYQQREIAKLLGFSPALINKEMKFIRSLLDPDPDGDGGGGKNCRARSSQWNSTKEHSLPAANRGGGAVSALSDRAIVFSAEDLKRLVLLLPAFRECKIEAVVKPKVNAKGCPYQEVYLRANKSVFCGKSQQVAQALKMTFYSRLASFDSIAAISPEELETVSTDTQEITRASHVSILDIEATPGRIVSERIRFRIFQDPSASRIFVLFDSLNEEATIVDSRFSLSLHPLTNALNRSELWIIASLN